MLNATGKAWEHGYLHLQGETLDCEVGVYIIPLENMPTPIFGEPLKFIIHGHISETNVYLPGLILKLPCSRVETLRLWRQGEPGIYSHLSNIKVKSSLVPRPNFSCAPCGLVEK